MRYPDGRLGFMTKTQIGVFPLEFSNIREPAGRGSRSMTLLFEIYERKVTHRTFFRFHGLVGNHRAHY